MNTNPFLMVRDQPEYRSAIQEEALSRMMHVVETRALGVLTGEVGSGKSTLMRIVASSLAPSDYQVVYLSSSRMSPRELYAGTLRAMGETPAFSSTRVKQQWRDVLDARSTGNTRQLVLLIDEAHDMPETTLLELRFLMTHGMEPNPAFAVVLAGQGKLRRDLNTNLLEPISQRVRMQYHLGGMSAQECARYILHTMQKAELDRPVFTEGALKSVHAASQGIPRVVNLLCGSALMLVGKNGENAVEEKHIAAVIADIDRQRGARS
jgi:type II secretory pathway predicted ATPase ExeA